MWRDGRCPRLRPLLSLSSRAMRIARRPSSRHRGSSPRPRASAASSRRGSGAHAGRRRRGLPHAHPAVGRARGRRRPPRRHRAGALDRLGLRIVARRPMAASPVPPTRAGAVRQREAKSGPRERRPRRRFPIAVQVEQSRCARTARDLGSSGSGRFGGGLQRRRAGVRADARRAARGAPCGPQRGRRGLGRPRRRLQGATTVGGARGASEGDRSRAHTRGAAWRAARRPCARSAPGSTASRPRRRLQHHRRPRRSKIRWEQTTRTRPKPTTKNEGGDEDEDEDEDGQRRGRRRGQGQGQKGKDKRHGAEQR